jgi:hypothetical protein
MDIKSLLDAFQTTLRVLWGSRYLTVLIINFSNHTHGVSTLNDSLQNVGEKTAILV